MNNLLIQAKNKWKLDALTQKYEQQRFITIARSEGIWILTRLKLIYGRDIGRIKTKKASTKTCKCLKIKVEKMGLEPTTS